MHWVNYHYLSSLVSCNSDRGDSLIQSSSVTVNPNPGSTNTLFWPELCDLLHSVQHYSFRTWYCCWRPAICVACVWDVILIFSVIPAYLIRPGIGWNASYTLGDLMTSRLLQVWFYDSFMYCWVWDIFRSYSSSTLVIEQISTQL